MQRSVPGPLVSEGHLGHRDVLAVRSTGSCFRFQRVQLDLQPSDLLVERRLDRFVVRLSRTAPCRKRQSALSAPRFFHGAIWTG